MALPMTQEGRPHRFLQTWLLLTREFSKGQSGRRRACGGPRGQRSLVETGPRCMHQGSWQQTS